MDFVFRAFISYNSRDNEAVAQLVAGLARRGIGCIVDRNEQPHSGGVPAWIEQMMAESDAVIVCSGPHGLGNWQRAEADVAITMQIEHGHRVVNVLLPDAPESPELPALLKRYPWENFRSGFSDEAAFDRLAFVLTGRRDSARERPSVTLPTSRSAQAPQAERTEVADAVRYLAESVQKGKSVTFFVGSRLPRCDVWTPTRRWDVARQLLQDLGAVSEGEEHRLLPSLDNVGAYYAYQRGPDGLERKVRDGTRRPPSGVTVHRALSRMLSALHAGGGAVPYTSEIIAAGQRPQLVVTTRLDTTLEQEFLGAGLSFTRIVQVRDGSRVETSYSDVQRLSGGGVQITSGTGRTRSTHRATTPDAVDAIIARPEAAARVRAGAVLSLARAERLVLYKYHGSHDVENSCAISTDQYFDTAKAVRVPQALSDIIMNTPSVFLDCGVLDTDFLHLYHTALADLFDQKIAPYERFVLQLPPALEPDDRSRSLEANMWESIKRRSLSMLALTILEERSDAFVEQLLDALTPATQRVA